MELYHGRPENTAGRKDNEVACYDLLDSLGIEYARTDHADMAAFTMEDCLKIDAVLGAPVCKNLFLCNRQHTAFYLLLMPGDKPFKTKELSSQINSSRLSFASGEEMEELIGCAPGSSSVLGLMNDTENRVRLLIDEDVLKNEYFGCHPCVNTASVRLSVADLEEKILPAVRHEMTVVRLVGAD